jgi:membrane dipeptidase
MTTRYRGDIVRAMTKWLMAFAISAAAVVVGCATNTKPTTKPVADIDPLMTRALAIQKQVPLIDGHNDLPWQLRQKAGSDLFKMNPRGPLPELHTDIPRLKKGEVGGVFFAAYTPYTMAERGIAARFTIEQIDLIHRLVDFAPELEFATTADEVERVHKSGKIAALIGIEGGHAIENSLAILRQYYALGVRYMTLTHTDTIDWADAAGFVVGFVLVAQPATTAAALIANAINLFVMARTISPR